MQGSYARCHRSGSADAAIEIHKSTSISWEPVINCGNRLSKFRDLSYDSKSYSTPVHTHKGMDPVSFAASLVTLLGLASAATEIVYNSILDIRDAPKEIRSQAVKLQCLHKTLRDLLAQYTRYAGNAQLYIDPLLEDNLREFLGDIQDLEVKLKNSSSKMSGSRKQHLRERLTWLSSDRKLRKFYDSLDEWNGIFNAAIKKTHGYAVPNIIILSEGFPLMRH